MTSFEKLLATISSKPISILDDSIPFSEYTLLDLSVNNDALENLNMQDPIVCQSYIDTVLKESNAQVAYGGYMEQRGLYSSNSHFNKKKDAIRNIHLGVDFWAKVGTKVHVPIKGKVHSFKNNNAIGDYGPTIVLTHIIKGIEFHTLYGHLSIESLENLYVGKEFKKGNILAMLGAPEINVNYAPHLHFQIIKDIESYNGDYPGVCTTKNKEYYRNNCQNPNFLLKV